MKGTNQPSSGQQLSVRPGALKRAGAILVLGAGVALSAVSTGQDDQPTTQAMEEAVSGLDTWVELRGQISKERASHAQEVAFLNDRIDLVREQVEDVKALTVQRQSEATESAKKRNELEAESEKLKAGSDALKEMIAPLEAKTLDLLKRMPEPVLDNVRALSQNIPKDPESTSLSLSKRYAQVAGVLGAIDKFNTKVHVTTEIRDFDGQPSVSVTTIYLGISQAYYVNEDATIAGRGAPGPDGFEWKPANDAAAQIQQAVKVLNGDLPQFVQVPIIVD